MNNHNLEDQSVSLNNHITIYIKMVKDLETYAKHRKERESTLNIDKEQKQILKEAIQSKKLSELIYSNNKQLTKKQSIVKKGKSISVDFNNENHENRISIVHRFKRSIFNHSIMDKIIYHAEGGILIRLMMNFNQNNMNTLKIYYNFKNTIEDVRRQVHIFLNEKFMTFSWTIINQNKNLIFKKANLSVISDNERKLRINQSINQASKHIKNQKTPLPNKKSESEFHHSKWKVNHEYSEKELLIMRNFGELDEKKIKKDSYHLNMRNPTEDFKILNDSYNIVAVEEKKYFFKISSKIKSNSKKKFESNNMKKSNASSTNTVSIEDDTHLKHPINMILKGPQHYNYYGKNKKEKKLGSDSDLQNLNNLYNLNISQNLSNHPNSLPFIQANIKTSNKPLKDENGKIYINMKTKAFYTPQKNKTDICYIISSDKYSNPESMTPFYVYNKNYSNYERQKDIYFTLKKNLKFGKANYVYANLSGQSKNN
jgi:hypothetical protein